MISRQTFRTSSTSRKKRLREIERRKSPTRKKAMEIIVYIKKMLDTIPFNFSWDSVEDDLTDIIGGKK
jgi:hypothetical protein